MGTGDSNGQASNFTGDLQIKSICNPPAPSVQPPCTDAGDQADLKLDAQFTDIRNVTTLTDYTGELQVKTTLRITDRVNGPTGANPATAVNVPFSFTVPCSGDGDTTVGSTCTVSTTADALNPGIVPEGKRSVWSLGQVQVSDGGADGSATTADNTLFLTQGLFALSLAVALDLFKFNAPAGRKHPGAGTGGLSSGAFLKIAALRSSLRCVPKGEGDGTT